MGKGGKELLEEAHLANAEGHARRRGPARRRGWWRPFRNWQQLLRGRKRTLFGGGCHMRRIGALAASEMAIPTRGKLLATLSFMLDLGEAGCAKGHSRSTLIFRALHVKQPCLSRGQQAFRVHDTADSALSWLVRSHKEPETKLWLTVI